MSPDCLQVKVYILLLIWGFWGVAGCGKEAASEATLIKFSVTNNLSDDSVYKISNTSV